MARRPFSRTVVASAAAMALLVAVLSAWRFRASPAPVLPAPPGGSEPVLLEPRPMKVAEDVYMLGDMTPAAVYIVKTSDGLVLIDSGLEEEHERLVEGMQRLGLDVARTKMILLTHVHADHTMGARRLRDRTGAKVYIGRGDAEPLRSGGPVEALCSKFEMDQVDIHPTAFDGELDDGQVLQLGDARLTTLATPGHTPGSSCFLLETRGQRILFTGDTLMTLSANLGTYAVHLPPKYRADVHRYLESLRGLRQLRAPDLLLPGHPQFDVVPGDARLSDADWKSLIDLGMRDLEQVAQRYAADGADFLDGTPKKLANDLYYLGDLDGHAAYALVRDSRLFLFDASRGEDAARRVAEARRELGIASLAVDAILLTSCESTNLTGLRSLVEETQCRVIAAGECIGEVSRWCPDGTKLVGTDRLSDPLWEGLVVLPMQGNGGPAASYRFSVDGSPVLISGTILNDGDEMEFMRLLEEPPRPGRNEEQLLASLKTLERLEPKLWLPAVPFLGRNANLYDFDWQKIILRNRDLVRRSYEPGR